ncbi:MAG: hypothetical protein EOO01_27570 [Chitinophagaceae bacterium]|nr:MAG: hypothetical protein EOO01_27570 [Chitinophagaceae bacterium]
MKMIIVLPVLVLLEFFSIHAGNYTNTISSNILPDTILVINSFDAMAIEARDSKKDLFRELTENLSGYLSEAIVSQTTYTPLIIPGILNKTYLADSLVFSLMKQHHTRKAILIRSLDTYFLETGSKEETDDDGKPRIITSYNLCVKNAYSLFSSDDLLKESVIDYCEFFNTRSVKGRFGIRFGPDIVGKRKHTYELVAKNASNYIQSIQPLLNETDSTSSPIAGSLAAR